MSNEQSFELVLPPPPPFLHPNRAFDSRSAPLSKYYQPSIIYSSNEQSDNESHKDKIDWSLHEAPNKELRWSSDITMNQFNRHPSRTPDSGRIPTRTLNRSNDRTTQPSPLSSHAEIEEDLSCEFDDLSINTSTTHHNNDYSYERVPYRPSCCAANPYYLHHEPPRSEPSIQHSIHASHHLSAHIHPFDGPSSLIIYSTTSQHGRLVGSPDHLSRQLSSVDPQIPSVDLSSNGLFVETNSSSHEVQDCYAETASLGSSSFSNTSAPSFCSWAASPCQSPTSPFFDSSVGGQDPILSAGLDIFASQLQIARLRISAMAAVQESEDQ